MPSFLPPFLVLSLFLGAIYGTLFHLWCGKNLRDLLIYCLTGIIGFLFGQGLANLLGFNFSMIGQLHIVEATIVSGVTLFLVHWLKL